MSNKKETILSVEGMTCSSCIRHVESALSELEGIEKVEVKLKEGKVLSSEAVARKSPRGSTIAPGRLDEA